MASGQQLAGAVHSACPSYLLFVSDLLTSLTPVRPGTDARLILDVCTSGYKADASEIAPWRQALWRWAGGYESLTVVIYIAFANVAIPGVTLLYLRLLFLPSKQSVPPRRPEGWLSQSSDIVECSPDETPPTWQTCSKGRCGGRWKPARARHCSDCGVCRVGFDHHCPIVSP